MIYLIILLVFVLLLAAAAYPFLKELVRLLGK